MSVATFAPTAQGDGDRTGGQAAAPADAAPIEGYGAMTVRQIREQIAGLTPAQLRALQSFESRHGNRAPVLEAIVHALT